LDDSVHLVASGKGELGLLECSVLEEWGEGERKREKLGTGALYL
jgi:hypothetical protein